MEQAYGPRVFRGLTHNMNIITKYEYPPIPLRDWDWSAIDDDTYDGPGCPIGLGSTKEAAIADLLQQIEQNTMTKIYTVKNKEETICICYTREKAESVINAFGWMESECGNPTDYHIEEEHYDNQSFPDHIGD
jgi:hypothetical protein